MGCTAAQAKTRLSAYWDSIRADDPRRLPCMGDPHHRETAVSIGLHGDAVPCTKKDSLDVVSFFSLLGAGPTVAICFFVFGIFSKAIVDFAVLAEFEAWDSGGTWDAVWDIVIWSLRALEDGTHPLTDHRGEPWLTEPYKSLAGTPLAGGFSATFMNVRADAEFTYCHLDLPGHWGSHHRCHTCFADATSAVGSPTHYLSFGPSATWPLTLFLRMADFYAFGRLKNKPVHKLLRPRTEGGMGLHVLVFLRDTLHCMDLGVSMHTAGNVLWLLVFSDYIAVGDPQAAIRQLSADVMELYEFEKTPSRFTNVDLWMFCDPASPTSSSPLLKGKGAEVRHLIPILHLVWRKYAQPTSDHDKHVDQLLRCLSDIYSILGWKTDDHETPLFLSEDASAELRNLTDVFLMENSYLEKLALERLPPLPLWHMVSKYHSM